MTEHPTDVSLIHYVRALRRGLWIIVLATVLVTLGAVYASRRQETLYRSSADVFLSNQNLATSLSNVQSSSSEDPVRAAATQATLASTPQVARLALRIARLSDRSPDELLARSSVSSASNADILTFSVTDPDRLLAQRLAQAYATAYTRYRRQLDTATIAEALKKLDLRLAQLKAAGQQRSAAYNNLLDKEQQLSTLQVLQSSNAQLVRPAEPAAQTQPKTLRNGALAAIGGLILGIALAILRDALNTRVRSAAEVQNELGLPLLARLPELPRRLRGRGRLVMVAAPNSPGAETYRILATNLDLVNVERQARSIMFTSAQSGEGKSTTVANVAIAHARAGRHVVLADLDLRAPSLADFFLLGDNRGLTDVALGGIELDEALARVPIREYIGSDDSSQNGSGQGLLEVLPVGVPPPNPGEFAASRVLAELLARLEKRADLVLIDAPPLLHLSDGVTLTSRVDALVIVVRPSLIKRQMLRELRRVLAAAPVAKLGFVLTGADTEDEYGAGYGYSHEIEVASDSAAREVAP